MTDYLVIYEQAGDGSWSASAADLPVFAVGDTREDAEQRIREAIAFHLDCLRADGLDAPKPVGVAGVVSI
jgi:predicted RNase H-like HicB family nuclease